MIDPPSIDKSCCFCGYEGFVFYIFTTVTEASEAFNLTGLWGDSHRESRRTALLRYFPDLCFGKVHRWTTLWYFADSFINRGPDGISGRSPSLVSLNHWMFAGPPLGVWRLLDAEVGEDFPLMSVLEYANIMRCYGGPSVTKIDFYIECIN